MRRGFIQTPSSRLRPEELKARLRDLHSSGPEAAELTDKDKGTVTGKERNASTFDLKAALRAVDKDEEKEKGNHGDLKQPSRSSGRKHQQANEFKDKGNSSFQKGEFVQACEEYTQSINAQPTCIAYANRAMAKIKLKQFSEAIDDATKALELDGLYVKAFLRRGTAHELLGQTENALDDFEAALRLEPQNKSAIESRKTLIREWAKQNGFSGVESNGEIIPVKLAATGDGGGLQHRPEKPFLVPVETKKIADGLSTSTNQLAVDQHAADRKGTVDFHSKQWKSTNTRHDIKLTSSVKDAGSIEPPKRIPKTGVEFESIWRGLKGNRTSQASFILLLQPPQLVNVLKQALTPALLFELQMVLLKDAMEVNPTHAAALLAALAQVPRFKLNTLSLSNTQKKALSAAWDVVMEGQLKDTFLSLRPAFSV